MTIQDAKDQVARDKNFRDWIDMCARDHYTNMEHAADKIAQIYGDSQYNQGIDDAIKAARNSPPEMVTEQEDSVIEDIIMALKKLKR